MEKITLCGDNCLCCPRYTAKNNYELHKTAELWYRMKWRDKIVSVDEIKCGGCSSHKECTYNLVECIKENKVEKCNQCSSFPCGKIDDMLKRSDYYRETAKKICSEDEYALLDAAFFNKKINLMK